MSFSILLIFAIICGIIYFISTKKDASERKSRGNLLEKKALIVYFSLSGNTKLIAEKIQAQTGADLYRIEPRKEYPTNIEQTKTIAKKEIENGILPEVKQCPDIYGYELIYLGMPVWWSAIPPVIKTFIIKSKFNGKIVVPFITHSDDSKCKLKKDITELCASNTQILEPFIVNGKGDSNVSNEIRQWLKRI